MMCKFVSRLIIWSSIANFLSQARLLFVLVKWSVHSSLSHKIKL